MYRSASSIFLTLLGLQLASCRNAGVDEAPFTVLDHERTGLHAANRITPTPAFNLFSYMYFYNGSGLGAGDFDRDGRIDLFFASNQQGCHLYLNRGDIRFEDVSAAAGIPSDSSWNTGVSVVDINNDGWLDILVFNINDAPCLLRNHGQPGQNWLKVVPTRKDNGQIAIHSQVTVKAKTLTMIQPVLAVQGYLVSNDPRAHFGLGTATQADTVEIRWPDGRKQVLENVPANQILKVCDQKK